MGEQDWDHYEIPLTPPPIRRAAASALRPVVRPLASRTARLVAVILDLFVSNLPVAVVFLMTQNSAESPETTNLRFTTWITGAAGVEILQWILLSLRGQTLGKIAMGVQIVDQLDGSNPGFFKAVVLRLLVRRLLSIIPLFALIDVLFILGEDRRCIHDLIAGTKVVAI
jgi:uncharacterized RDD family membrane protein YckC